MLPSLSHYDQRNGDTYVVTLDAKGEFVLAYRYIDKVGFNPIVYEELEEVPQPHRNEIEDLIHKNQQT